MIMVVETVEAILNAQKNVFWRKLPTAMKVMKILRVPQTMTMMRMAVV